MQDIIKWLETNLITILLPLISAWAAWFFSRNRTKTEIQKDIAETHKIEAERTKILHEAESISVMAAEKAIAQWIQMYEMSSRQYDSLKQTVIDLNRKLEYVEHKLDVHMRVVDYLLQEMQKYSPETVKLAREMLNNGLNKDNV